MQFGVAYSPPGSAWHVAIAGEFSIFPAQVTAPVSCGRGAYGEADFNDRTAALEVEAWGAPRVARKRTDAAAGPVAPAGRVTEGRAIRRRSSMPLTLTSLSNLGRATTSGPAPVQVTRARENPIAVGRLGQPTNLAGFAVALTFRNYS